MPLILFSCNSTRQEHAEINAPPEDETLSLVFCGDVMAHTQNFRMKDYSQIWEDIKEITQNSDFTFANIESPINDEAPFENYPTFNMQYSYPQAAVDAGIKGIWNFAHIDLEVPENVVVENVHLSESLMTLSYNITRLE